MSEGRYLSSRDNWVHVTAKGEGGGGYDGCRKKDQGPSVRERGLFSDEPRNEREDEYRDSNCGFYFG
jgi:hypothetical protein